MACLTAKIQILPNEENADLLSETMRQYASACNFVAENVFRTHDIKQGSLNKELYHQIRDNFHLGSQMAQSVIITVIARYKTILTNQKKWIQPNFKHPQYDLVWNGDYSLTRGVFSVNTLSGRVKLNYYQKGMEQYFDGSWKFGTAKLVTKHGKWFLHIPMTKDVPELEDTSVSNVVGVDLGVNFLVATYDSSGKSKFFPGGKVKQKRAQNKAVRKELQRRQTPSARRRLKKIGQRENRWMADVNHQVSKALAEFYPTGTLFVLEDLTGIRGATEKVALKQRYVLVNWAFYDLRKKIEYKAQIHGSKAIAVDPKYTSQTCPKCGHTHKLNRDKKNHIFVCRTCGYTSNDDRIGAMNLHRKGIEYLSAVAGE